MARAVSTKIRFMRIIGIDPGVTSGVVWGIAVGGHFECSGFCELRVLNVKSDLDRLGRFVRKWDSELLIIENFILYPGRQHVGGQAKDGLSPVAATYMLLGWLQRDGLGHIPVVKQMKIQADAITNDMLRKGGLWFKGKQHARDAARHAELWARKNTRVGGR